MRRLAPTSPVTGPDRRELIKRSHRGAPGRGRARNTRQPLGENRCAVRVCGAVRARSCAYRSRKRRRLVRHMHVPYTGSRCQIEGMVPHVNEFNKINHLEKVFHDSFQPGAPGRGRESNKGLLGENRCAVRVCGAVRARSCAYRSRKRRRLVRLMHVPYTGSRCQIEGKHSLVRESNKINNLKIFFMKVGDSSHQ